MTEMIERIRVQSGNSPLDISSNFRPAKTPMIIMVAILIAIPVYLKARLG